VVTAADGDAARELIETDTPSLVLLDVMLPGETTGLDLCRWIRSSSELPVILLTARVEEADRIVGLELGADDYVTKPFSPRELATRVKAVLRRVPSARPPLDRVSAGPLEIDATTREARRDGELLALTAREFDLLWFLASNANQVFSRDQLMSRDRVRARRRAAARPADPAAARRVARRVEAPRRRRSECAGEGVRAARADGARRLVQRDGRQPRAALRRTPRARRVGEPRPAHAA